MRLEPKPLRVAILGKSNHLGGGASKCSGLLAEGLRAAGHEATHFTIHAPRPAADSRPLSPRFAPLLRRFHAASRRFLGVELVPWELPFLLSWPRRHDLVHINDHWQAVSPF